MTTFAEYAVAMVVSMALLRQFMAMMFWMLEGIDDT